MSRRRAALWSVGIGSLAAVAVAASRAAPVEATVPPHGLVPAAERVESVLRATYVLPAGRGRMLAELLRAHSVPELETRLRSDGTGDRIMVVAPADVQKALGTFIEKCVNREPQSTNGAPTLAPPTGEDAPPYGTFAPDRGSPAGPAVPDYGDPAAGDRQEDGFGPPEPIRRKVYPPDDGFRQTPKGPGESPFRDVG